MPLRKSRKKCQYGRKKSARQGCKSRPGPKRRSRRRSMRRSRCQYGRKKSMRRGCKLRPGPKRRSRRRSVRRSRRRLRKYKYNMEPIPRRTDYGNKKKWTIAQQEEIDKKIKELYEKIESKDSPLEKKTIDNIRYYIRKIPKEYRKDPMLNSLIRKAIKYLTDQERISLFSKPSESDERNDERNQTTGKQQMMQKSVSQDNNKINKIETQVENTFQQVNELKEIIHTSIETQNRTREVTEQTKEFLEGKVMDKLEGIKNGVDKFGKNLKPLSTCMKNFQDIFNFITFRGVESKITMMQNFVMCLVQVISSVVYYWVKAGLTYINYMIVRPFKFFSSTNLLMPLNWLSTALGALLAICSIAGMASINPFVIASSHVKDGYAKDILLQLQYVWWEYAIQKIWIYVPMFFTKISGMIIYILNVLETWVDDTCKHNAIRNEQDPEQCENSNLIKHSINVLITGMNATLYTITKVGCSGWYEILPPEWCTGIKELTEIWNETKQVI